MNLCADLERFVRGCPNLIRCFFFFFLFLVDKGIEDPNTIIMKWAISMAFRWQADNGPTLNAGLVAL